MSAGEVIQGRRADGLEIQAGDYWKGVAGSWTVWVPGTHFIAEIGPGHSGHTVTEHEDGSPLRQE